MADLTWSVKMPEELKDKVGKKLLDSGLTGKEFMESLLSSYELQMVKFKRPEIVSDLQELEALSKRLCSIYVNLGEKMTSILTDKENGYKEVLKEKDESIKNQVEKVRLLESSEKELKEKVSNAEREKDILAGEKVKLERRTEKEITQLKEVNGAHKAVIEEYKEKTDTLKGLVVELKGYKKEVEKLQGELEQERDKRKELQLSFTEAEKNLKMSEDELIRKEEYFKKEIKSLKEQSVYEKDKALLDLEKSLRNEMQVLREEYNGKVRGLLEELEVRQRGQGQV